MTESARKQSSEALAIIPARGGSKGIPRKNLYPLAGKPLLAYSILAARQAKRITRVVVSTEDAEIKETALLWGAEVVDRPPELATDQAATDPVLEQVVEHLARTQSYQPDLVVLLQPTSPLRAPGLVDACIQRLEETGADSLLTVFEGHHFFWRRRHGRLEANYNPVQRPRRQDIPEEEHILLENGSVYVTRREILTRYHSRLAGKIEWYVMPAADSVEVDSPEHLEIIGAQLQRRQPAPPHSLRDVRLVVLDFDGVMTDNRVWVSETGQEVIAANRSDGLGIGLLRKAGVEVVVVSAEVNPVVAARCRKLGIRCQHGLADKAAALRQLVAELQVPWSQVAYAGNDTNDLACFKLAGHAFTVADAHPRALAEAQYVLQRPGGHGAVRELCDLILASRAAKPQ